MANSQLFNSKSASIEKTDTKNRAGGRAYSMSAKHALAQYAVTGVFGNTFYSTSGEQLEKVLELVNKVDTEFIAKLAVYSRQVGFMKDMPALLLAVLASRDVERCKQVFFQVVDNGRMLRNFVQIVRSGVTGRKSLGSAPKKLIQQWLDSASHGKIFRDSVGKNPSMADIVKMVHPKPKDKVSQNLYGYLLDGNIDGRKKYPQLVKEFEAFKNGTKDNRKIPDVPFQMLTSSDLSTEEWKEIAKNAKWHMTRMNLNTFKRNGVLDDPDMVQLIANRLRSEEDIKAAKVFPYQVFTAYMNAEVPQKIKSALHDAVEVATENVPEFPGKVFVGVDCSASMGWPITGSRSGRASKMNCNQVASLFASSVLRKNEDTEVFIFDTETRKVDLDARDTILTNADKLAREGGGTNVSSFLKKLNNQRSKGDLVIIVSDNESWCDRGGFWNRGTALSEEWSKFKTRNKDAKLVCIDIQANEYTQAKDRADSLNVGGFSDNVFTVINSFLESGGNPEYWVNKIESEVKI